MNTFATRTAAGLLGAVALAGLAAGVANAEQADHGRAHGASATGPTWVLQDVPVPIEEPTFGIFDALAPVYNLVSGLS